MALATASATALSFFSGAKGQPAEPRTLNGGSVRQGFPSMMRGSPPTVVLTRAGFFKSLFNAGKEDEGKDPSYEIYDSEKTVFPAEACDSLGEEFCNVEGVFEEVKLPPSPAQNAVASEGVDREVFDYESNPKTVFPGEACDELGGEFCAAEYQEGVGQDVKLANA